MVIAVGGKSLHPPNSGCLGRAGQVPGGYGRGDLFRPGQIPGVIGPFGFLHSQERSRPPRRHGLGHGWALHARTARFNRFLGRAAA